MKKVEKRDHELMGKTLAEGRRAMEEGKVGVAALLLWHDEVMALNHNLYQETGDVTAHAEMTVLRQSARRLNALDREEKGYLTLYSTLQPCLMCFSAISFAGIKRVVYSALNEDGQRDVCIIHGVNIDQINALLEHGPIELVAGVRRDEGRALLEQMGKLRGGSR